MAVNANELRRMGSVLDAHAVSRGIMQSLQKSIKTSVHLSSPPKAQGKMGE
jgi:hypothetical protein